MHARHHEMLRIGADHPALPGHFPGNPVVPGVVLLDAIAAAVARWRGGARVAALPQVKFLRPLLPGEDAELVLEDTGGGARFRITIGDAVVASGQLALAP